MNKYDQDEEGVEGSNCYICKQIFVIPRYTFENFVIYSENSFAHAACLEVAKNPGKEYNPLFIHGNVGMGKTHLLCAIGNHLLTHGIFAPSRICCISAESFTMELINAIRHKELDSFRQTFRSVDILLMSSIQFLAGKERTVTELIHTFDTLYDEKKQIVFECDLAPGDITYMPEGLKSRFQWGLIAGIGVPDYAAKSEIVRQKAGIEGIDLPDAVIEFIAHTCQGSIRALEGTVIKLAAYSRLFNVPITIDGVTRLLKDE